jgi:hypothetical protein
LYYENPAPHSSRPAADRKKLNDKLERGFLDTRRLQRELIGTEGVAAVWAKSPEPESSEDDKHVKLDKKSKKTKKNKKKSSKSKKRKKEKKSKKKRKKSKKSSSSSNDSSSSGEEWVEKIADGKRLLRTDDNDSSKMTTDDEDMDGEVGPLVRNSNQLNQKDFGRALLPGEGAAMAQYVVDGKRIPRRGEIGLTSDEIDTFEKVGYVMSGSRLVLFLIN